jgi:hypothetical protein
MILPQTTLGQISIAPWTDRPPPREKKEKKTKLNNKQQQKRQVAKTAGCPEYQRGRRGIRHGTINKQTGRRNRSGGTCPATRSREACKSGSIRKTPLEKRGKATSHINCK